MMFHAAPRFAVFGVSWVMLLVAAIAVAVLATRKRRNRYAAGPGPATYQLAGRYNPTTASAEYRPAGRCQGSGPIRRSFWGVVVALIVVAVVIKGLSVQVHNASATVTGPYDLLEPGPPSGYPMTAAARVEHVVPTAKMEPFVATAKKEEPAHRKPKPWFKADRPLQDGAQAWIGTIERSTIASLADSDGAKWESIDDGLAKKLALDRLPPLAFVTNPAWVRVAETDRQKLQRSIDEAGEDVFHINYQVEVTPDGWHELGRFERAGRGETRMAWAACGLGLLTILLGGIAAYIRLDEWTKGYYSGRLFLAASALATGLAFLIVYTIRSWGMPGG